jgi:probable non-F420 flavinoid oxidoreductase
VTAPIFGIHASHEQHPPSRLLRYVARAEAAGFRAAMCSDHFHPWSTRQGHSGFAWSWLGAALQATALPFGVVCAPGQRYHPAVIAQAAATLAEMFPGRFWVAVGSGEALNEAITGEPWPPKAARDARLLESAGVMRRLWRGETVDHTGLVRVRSATLWTRPAAPPALLGAALSPESAEWIAGWADGLITAGSSIETLKPIVEAFRRGGGRAKRLVLQAAVSYAPTEDEALSAAVEQWRHAALPADALADLETPERFDAATRDVAAADVRDRLLVSSDVGRYVGWIEDALGLGFDEIYFHHVGREIERFVDVFGAHVLPRVGSVSSAARTPRRRTEGAPP